MVSLEQNCRFVTKIDTKLNTSDFAGSPIHSCPSGEIGRRTGLKILGTFTGPCQFDSGLGHHSFVTMVESPHVASEVKINLLKNGVNFILLAPVGIVSDGGEVDIQEKQELLNSREMITNGAIVNTVNSYGLATLASSQSTIKALNTLTEVTVNSAAY